MNVRSSSRIRGPALRVPFYPRSDATTMRARRSGAGILTATFLLAAACSPAAPPADPPVRIAAAPVSDGPPTATPPGTLRRAVLTLDTLYAPPPGAPAATLAIMAALRDIRNGRMDAALGRLVPVAEHTGPDAALGREILGELLFHRGEWAALSGSSDGLASLFSMFAQAEPETWSFPSEVTVLPLEVTAVGTPLVQARINGVTRKFWLDTGAGLTVVSSEVAEAAGIQVGESGAQAGTATSREVAVRAAIIDELALGPVHVRNHPAIVIAAADLHFDATELSEPIMIDGILGWPLIRRLDLTLDFAGRRVVIREPAPRTEGPRNLFWLGYPAVSARTDNGRPLLLGFDTGASSSELAPRFLDAAGVRPDGTRSRRIGSAGGFDTVTVQTVDSAALRLDDWRLLFRTIDVRDFDEGSLLELDGVLGSDIAVGRAVRIDFFNGRLDLLPRDGGE